MTSKRLKSFPDELTEKEYYHLVDALGLRHFKDFEQILVEQRKYSSSDAHCKTCVRIGKKFGLWQEEASVLIEPLKIQIEKLEKTIFRQASEIESLKKNLAICKNKEK